MKPSAFFPPKIFEFLLEMEELGFSLCLVGGAVRDYLMTKKTSNDLDFEIRSRLNISDTAWVGYYEKLTHFCEKKKIKITKFPYLITKIDYLGWSLEFSSPRREVFEALELHSHHNFNAVLSSTLSYADSFKRRDFTINAIGLELSLKDDKMLIIDPFGGEKDLNLKALKLIDENFFKDSVRFLRLIRFSIKYQMTIDPFIRENLTHFNFSALSKYHFISELFKTDPARFLMLWKDLFLSNHLVNPKEYLFFKEIDWSKAVNKIQTKEDLLLYVFLIKSELAKEVQSFFSIPNNSLKEFINLYNSMNNLLKLKIEDFEQVLNQHEETALESDIFKFIKNLDEKKEIYNQMVIFSPQLKITYWDDFSKYIVLEEINLACLPKYRAIFKYYKALKKWINHD